MHLFRVVLQYLKAKRRQRNCGPLPYPGLSIACFTLTYGHTSNRITTCSLSCFNVSVHLKPKFVREEWIAGLRLFLPLRFATPTLFANVCGNARIVKLLSVVLLLLADGDLKVNSVGHCFAIDILVAYWGPDCDASPTA